MTPARAVPEGVRQRLFRLPPAVRVGMLSVGLAAAALIAYLVGLGQIGVRDGAIAIPWWILAAGFCLVDLKVIEVHFRRESHAFSLYELPAVIGLFVLSPGDYVLAVAVGGGLALAVTSWSAPIKVAFNLANYLFLAVVSLVVFHAIAGTASGPPGPGAFIAAFAAAAVATVLGALTIASAITLSGGAPQFEKLPEMLQFGTLVAIANTSIGLLAVTLLWTSPGALWLLLLPVGALFLAYRAWVSEREKHERLELSTSRAGFSSIRRSSTWRLSRCSTMRARCSAPSSPKSSCMGAVRRDDAVRMTLVARRRPRPMRRSPR